MTRILIAVAFILVALPTGSDAKSALPSDSLEGVETVQVSLLFGGALGDQRDRSLFAANPQLADTLGPCIDALIRSTLSQRSISMTDRINAGPDGDEPGNELVIAIFGRPITIGTDPIEVASYFIDLQFFSDRADSSTEQSQESSGRSSYNTCEDEIVYESTHLNTVLPSELSRSILADVTSLIRQFAFNPAYCVASGRGSACADIVEMSLACRELVPNG